MFGTFAASSHATSPSLTSSSTPKGDLLEGVAPASRVSSAGSSTSTPSVSTASVAPDDKSSGKPVSGPAYTIRMLLSDVRSDKGTPPKLKPFSHFTLGCTAGDEASSVAAAFKTLSASLEGPVTFKAKSVINLGSEAQPLWAVSLEVGDGGIGLRTTLSRLFDPMMCPEKNGTLFRWGKSSDSVEKCAHLTLGPRDEDLAIATRLLDCSLTFDKLDYKKVGPHDPHVSTSLTKAGSSTGDA